MYVIASSGEWDRRAAAGARDHVVRHLLPGSCKSCGVDGSTTSRAGWDVGRCRSGIQGAAGIGPRAEEHGAGRRRLGQQNASEAISNCVVLFGTGQIVIRPSIIYPLKEDCIRPQITCSPTDTS